VQCTARIGATSVASIGVRPTIDSEGQPLLEVFLFDFDETIWPPRDGRIRAKLRDEEKYDTLDALTRNSR
jgi:riboflavin kinase/FMN adenylyltransferase